jgi:hypothetical protein
MQLDLEAVNLIERRGLQLHFGPKLYADGQRGVRIIFGDDFNHSHNLVRLSRIRRTDRARDNCEAAEQEEANSQ